MKIISRLLVCLLFAQLAALNASAQVLARDDAAGYFTIGGATNAGWGFSTTTNGGFGLNPWVFRTNGLNFSGFFVEGNAGTIGTTNASGTQTNAWGMYANNSVGVKAAAFRSFTNSLPVNAVFKIKWRNLGIGNTTDNLGGFCLRNGNANATVDDASPLDASVRLAFYYIGGIDDNFRYYDSAGAHATGLGFGSGPFEVNVLLLSADSYRLVVKNPAGTTVITNYEGTLAGSGTIDSLACFWFQNGGNQLFNSLEISSTSLIPPDIQNVSPANGTPFVASDSPISFTVSSPFSGVASNNVTLSLNGTNTTGLSFSGPNGF